jgi:hypothetical protein
MPIASPIQLLNDIVFRTAANTLTRDSDNRAVQAVPASMGPFYIRAENDNRDGTAQGNLQPLEWGRPS